MFFQMKDFSIPGLLFNYNNPDHLFFKINTNPVTNSKDLRIYDFIFQTYDVNLYVYENFADQLTQIIIIFAVCQILRFFKKRVHFKKKVEMILDIVYSFFLWTWPVTIAHSSFRHFILYFFRNLYFCQFKTSKSKADLCLSVFVFVLYCLFFLHCFCISIYVIEKEEINQTRKKSVIKKTLENVIQRQNIVSENSVGSERKNLKNNELLESERKSFTIENEMDNNKFEKTDEANQDVKIPKKLKIHGRIQNKFSTFWRSHYSILFKEEYMKKYNCLFKEFKLYSLKTANFGIFELLRILLFAMVVVFLYELVIFQVVLLLFINLYFFVLILVSNPFKDNFAGFLSIMKEISILYGTVAIGILAFYDFFNLEDTELRENTGNHFIYSNIMLFGLFCINLLKILGAESLRILKICNQKISNSMSQFSRKFLATSMDKTIK